tara:strand:- start:1231 stop:1398 length:168 start_codon:yes stop_codon:yes gene_type:complete
LANGQDAVTGGLADRRRFFIFFAGVSGVPFPWAVYPAVWLQKKLFFSEKSLRLAS